MNEKLITLSELKAKIKENNYIIFKCSQHSKELADILCGNKNNPKGISDDNNLVFINDDDRSIGILYDIMCNMETFLSELTQNLVKIEKIIS